MSSHSKRATCNTPLHLAAALSANRSGLLRQAISNASAGHTAVAANSFDRVVIAFLKKLPSRSLPPDVLKEAGVSALRVHPGGSNIDGIRSDGGIVVLGFERLGEEGIVDGSIVVLKQRRG